MKVETNKELFQLIVNEIRENRDETKKVREDISKQNLEFQKQISTNQEAILGLKSYCDENMNGNKKSAISWASGIAAGITGVFLIIAELIKRFSGGN